MLKAFKTAIQGC